MIFNKITNRWVPILILDWLPQFVFFKTEENFFLQSNVVKEKRNHLGKIFINFQIQVKNV